MENPAAELAVTLLHASTVAHLMHWTTSSYAAHKALGKFYEQMPDLRFFRAGVSIPLPIFNRREGPIREATATLTQAGTAAKALRLELTSALERAYSTYQVANQQLASIEGGALKGALAALEGAQAAFRFGERGILEVLDAPYIHAARGLGIGRGAGRGVRCGASAGHIALRRQRGRQGRSAI